MTSAEWAGARPRSAESCAPRLWTEDFLCTARGERSARTEGASATCDASSFEDRGEPANWTWRTLREWRGTSDADLSRGFPCREAMGDDRPTDPLRAQDQRILDAVGNVFQFVLERRII